MHEPCELIAQDRRGGIHPPISANIRHAIVRSGPDILLFSTAPRRGKTTDPFESRTPRVGDFIEAISCARSIMENTRRSNENLIGLRASCDRCRSQKLRCVPLSKTNPTGPCQRCSKSKEPTPCVFSRRLRTGRQKKAADHQQHDTPHKRKTTFAQSLPGMSTFALSTSVSRESSVVPDTPVNSGTPRPSTRPKENNNNTASAGSTQDKSITAAGVWDHDSFFDSALVFPSPPCPADELCTDMESFLGVVNLLPTPPDTVNTSGGGDVSVIEPAESPGGPLCDFANMLPIMSRYESQLHEYGGELDNYPIGDALFLSQRFHAVLSSQCQTPLPSARIQMDIPTKLLTLSCYMTLTRIYSLIFGFMQRYLANLSNTHAIYDHTGFAGGLMEDIHSYRGLRLSQLQHTCLCGGCEAATRTKKAVSMLLDALGSVEAALGLPPDGRVIAEASKDGFMVPDRSRRDRTLLLDEGLVTGLINGRLHKTVREQVRELRASIEEVEDLLNGIL
ncbi:Zn(II)2Cys6 transcription factor domain-containing protein [Aspergillus lucknowensis]|uniref:Zn(2)-C6 fungal-type domain-containing protein n=1 Tax=Aspergillus lucknowensis TaxID=176173 RepID=A0ABR4L9F2_9EURO